MSQEKPTIIFTKEYHGFEDCVDIARDVYEMFDSRYNPEAAILSPEFMGTIKIVVTYDKDYKE